MLDQCCKDRLVAELCDECLLQLSVYLEELQRHEEAILIALQRLIRDQRGHGLGSGELGGSREPGGNELEEHDQHGKQEGEWPNWLDTRQYSELCAADNEPDAITDDTTEPVEWSKAVEWNIRTRRILNINRQRLHENETCAVKMDSLCRKYERTKIVLLNTCFYISVFDDCGVINGCRIGRRPSSWVPSEEINTGLGYLALLISTVRRRVFSYVKNLKLPRPVCHSILVRGRQSAITIDRDDQAEYPLSIVDGLFVPYFHVPKLDVALVALLEIYRDVVQIMRSHLFKDLGQEPFRVTEEGYVRGISIRYGNNEYEWTECIKLFLIDVKWFVGEMARWEAQCFSCV